MRQSGQLEPWARAGTNPESDESSGGSSSGATVASWSLSLVRYFLVDYDNGNDANPGFIDAAAGSTFTAGQVSANAIKTIEQLNSIVPTIGNGRQMVILIRARAGGANYFDKDGVTQSNLTTQRWLGYLLLLVRGSTDLTNSATDRVTCGFTQAVVGPNGDGSFTVDTGPTTTSIPIVFASGGFTVDGVVQFRVRIITGARAGQVRIITANATHSLTLDSATSGGAVSAGDTVMIEQPGVRVSQVFFDGRTSGVQFAANFAAGTQLVGIAATSNAAEAWNVAGYRMLNAGCELTGAATAAACFFVNNVTNYTLSDSYTDEAGTLRGTGMGMRMNCGSSWSAAKTLNVRGLGTFNAAAAHNVSAPMAGTFGDSSYIKGQLAIVGPNVAGVTEGPGALSGQWCVGSPSTSRAQMRYIGTGAGVTPFELVQNVSNCQRINFEGMSGSSRGCIYVKDSVGGSFNIDGCTSDGTANWFVDVANCEGVVCRYGRTIANAPGTTASGEVRLHGDAYATQASLDKTNVMDDRGNHFIGAAGVIAEDFVLATCTGADGLAVGEPALIDTVTANGVAAANWDLAANATCVGICVIAAAQNAKTYLATSGKPYVLNTGGTVSQGGIAFVATGTGGIGIATSTAVPSGKFQQRLGRWMDGTSGVDGHLVFNPELIPVAVP